MSEKNKPTAICLLNFVCNQKIILHKKQNISLMDSFENQSFYVTH